jgi:hypothetical protein
MAKKLYLGINTISHDPTLAFVPQVISTVELGEAPGRCKINQNSWYMLPQQWERNKMNE